MKLAVPLLIWFFCVIGRTTSAGEGLVLKSTIPLPGVSGRFDHFAIDITGGRLFVAALGNNTVEVLDVKQNRRLKSLTGIRKPTGVTFLPDRNLIGVAGGEEGVFKIFSGETYAPTVTIAELDDADNVRQDPSTKRIFVGYGSGSLAIIKDFQKAGEIKLAGHPESFQVEKNGKRIFVNVPDAGQIAAVDREKGSVIQTWPMTKFRSNFPMALDEANGRLFVGCRQPARLVVLNTQTGAEMANAEVSGDTDDLFYDAKRERVYLSCGEGFIDIISAQPGAKLDRLPRVATRSGARTSFYSADFDRLYLAVPRRIVGAAAEIQIYEPR